MIKERDLPALPEAAWIERNDRAKYAAASGEFEHEPRAHRTADRINAVQVVFVDKLGERIGEGADRDFAGERWSLAVTGQINGDHLTLGG